MYVCMYVCMYVGCSVALTQDLKSISIAIPLSSSEISKQLLKRPLKSRESDHQRLNKRIFLEFIANHSAIFKTPKSQRLPYSNSPDTSCMVIQIVLLNIVQDGWVFWCGLTKKSVCYNSYNSDGSSGPWILNGLLSSFIDKCC